MIVRNHEEKNHSEILEAAGTGEDYRGAGAGCSSGVRMSVWRPGEVDTYSWCIPSQACTHDGECPDAASSVTGVAWRCHAAVVGARSGDSYRLCMDSQETLCDMW